MAKLESDIKTVRVQMRRLIQAARVFAEDFASCAEMGETGEIIGGAALSQELHLQAEVFAQRADIWAADIEEQQGRLAEIFRKHHSSDHTN